MFETHAGCVVKLQGRFIFHFLLCTSAVCWDSPLPLHFRTCNRKRLKGGYQACMDHIQAFRSFFPNMRISETQPAGAKLLPAAPEQAQVLEAPEATLQALAKVSWVFVDPLLVCIVRCSFSTNLWWYFDQYFDHTWIYNIYNMFDPNYWIIYGSCCARTQTSQCHVVRCFQKTNVWRWKPCLVPT